MILKTTLTWKYGQDTLMSEKNADCRRVLNSIYDVILFVKRKKIMYVYTSIW